jgi:hypothetical protein
MMLGILGMMTWFPGIRVCLEITVKEFKYWQQYGTTVNRFINYTPSLWVSTARFLSSMT